MGLDIASQLLGARSLLARLAGVRFDGNRDYYKTFGYLDVISYLQAYAKYTRQNVAGRIVDMPADALWDNPPIITSNMPEWDAAWDNIVTNTNLWQVLNRLDRLSALDLYSALVIGVDGVPLDKAPPTLGRPLSKVRNILYLQPYAGVHALIQEWNEDKTSPEFRKPLVYNLIEGEDTRFAPGLKREPSAAVPVHSSHVVHVIDGGLENSVYGTPRLHRVFNDLDDLLKTTGGSAETFWMVANRGLQVDVDKEMKLEEADGEALSEELDDFMNGLRRFVRTRGVKIQNLGSDTPAPTANFDAITSLIAASSAIPKRILFGSEAGQLASEQDRANWSERILERRTHFAEPTVVFPFIRKVTNLGCLPAPDGLTITIQWPDPFRMSPLERAQTSAQKARSATNFAKALTTVIPGTEVIAQPAMPAQPAGTDPFTGAVTPATPATAEVKAVPPETLADKLLSYEEARGMMELEPMPPTFNETTDVTKPTG